MGVQVQQSATAARPGRPTGRSIVAGEVSPPLGSPPSGMAVSFQATDPRTGNLLPQPYLCASPADVDAAGWQAWEAFHAMGDHSAQERAILLEGIAREIESLGEDLLIVAGEETSLGPARLVAERDRTTSTLRMFASLIQRGDWVQAAIDPGEAARRPVAKPDLRRMLRPLGPVAVFGAGNFPLAYSTAGGDTASALAAGCPVIVKGHPGHPGAGEMVAQAVAAAVRACGFHPGTFSFLHAGGTREMEVGQELVSHRAIRAVGFTGSLGGGMALARLASSRPDPIPVFAEMGSTNPVFILPGALESQTDAIAERLVASMTNANGQMCTCPGLLFVPRGSDTEKLLRAMAQQVERVAPQPMLNHRTRDNFIRRCALVQETKGVEIRGGSPVPGHRMAPGMGEAGMPINASPVLYKTTFTIYRGAPTLHEEIFGPAAIIVLCDGEEQLVEAAASLQGSLTGTIWAAGQDGPVARRLEVILEQRVGRLIFNGVPTGVEVSAAMVHGGPYPSSNQAHSTAVGPFAIQRWCRPVCYQNAPEALLPAELRNANPLKIRRLVNGDWTDAPLKKGGESA